MMEMNSAQTTSQAPIPVPPISLAIKTPAGRCWADVVLAFTHGSKAEYRAALRRYNAICQPDRETAR